MGGRRVGVGRASHTTIKHFPFQDLILFISPNAILNRHKGKWKKNRSKGRDVQSNLVVLYEHSKHTQ